MNLCPPDSSCQLHPLCLVWWKPGCLCVALCGCHNHPTSGHIPWLECVHASVHEFMSTWLPMSAPAPMHSLTETWVPLYGSVFVSQSPHFCSHTLLRVCICISTCIYVHLTPMLAKPPMDSYMGWWVPVCGTVCVSQSPCLWSNTLIKMCTCISTCIHVHVTPHVCSTPFAWWHANMCAHVCHCVHPSHPDSILTPWLESVSTLVM